LECDTLAMWATCTYEPGFNPKFLCFAAFEDAWLDMLNGMYDTA